MSERQKRKVLVVDDDQDVCNMISGALEPKGFEVIIVPDPEEAIEKAKEIEPKLIFVSLVLSRSSGLKVSTSIHFHNIASLKTVPIFLMISNPDEFNKRYATYIGIKDVLIKPLNSDMIVSKTLKTIGEDTFKFERDEISQVSSVEEESGETSSEEKPGGLEGAETLRAKSELPGTSEEKIIEPKEDNVDKELDKGRKGEEHDFLGDREKRFRTRHFPYAIALIFAVIGILAFLFITDRDFLNTFFKKSSEKKEIVQVEKILESISTEDREAIKVVPSVTIGELNNIIIPPASTDKKEVIKEKPFSTEEAKTFNKITYSVHIGAFLIEENAVSLVNKFKQKGYEPFIRKVLRNNNEAIHRVLIGNFEDKDKALEQSKIIRQKEGLNSFVYNY